MKRKAQVVVVSALLFAAHGAAMSAMTDIPYPSDAEANYSLAALDTYADMQARAGGAEKSEVWGVSKRQAPTAHNPFPFGGGPVDD
jgi:hypothetical protein